MKTKTTASLVTLTILALSSLSGWKPHDVPAKSTGYSVSAVDLATGVTPEALMQAFQRNGFQTINGETFEQIIPGDTPSDAYLGIVALRDTTVQGPNEFVVGVGSDTVFWYESHNVVGDAVVDWEAHVKNRIKLVEALAVNKI